MASSSPPKPDTQGSSSGGSTRGQRTATPRTPLRKPREETVHKLVQQGAVVSPSPVKPPPGRPILGGTQSQNDIVSTSKLSAAAPVFVPRNMAPNPVPQEPEVNYGQWSVGEGFEDGGVFPEAEEPDWVSQFDEFENDPVYQVQKATFVLTTQPGNFDETMKNLVLKLTAIPMDDEKFVQMINTITEQAINETNFHYTGARMCNYLAENLKADVSTGNFRQHLMKLCHEEHMRCKKCEGQAEIQDRLIGFTMFLAELFLQMRIKGQRVIVLADGIKELLMCHLKNTNETLLLAAVKVLKLTGAALEDSRKELDGIFDRLREETLADQVRKNIKKQLLYVIELRASNWGRIDSPGGSTSSLPQTPAPFTQTEPVFYNAQGQVISREEAGYGSDYSEGDFGLWPEQFEEGYTMYPEEQWNGAYVMDPGPMDDEIEAAYEDFISQHP